MSAIALMADLTDHGIRLEAQGDRLRFRPRQAMTPELVRQVKSHKAELLTILATADMPETTREAFQSFDRAPTATKSDEAVIPATVPRCGRCSGNDFRDTPIHDGQSVRRDCAECGRTDSFPVWHGEATA